MPFSANYLENLKELFASTREIHIAVGVPAQGPAGFRRSHLAALDAYQVASASARIGVTGFADVGVLALLTADQELLRVMPGAARMSRWCLMPGAGAAPGTAARVQQAPSLFHAPAGPPGTSS